MIWILTLLFVFNAEAQQSIFRTQMALRYSKLGPQCAFDNLADAQKTSITDLSDAEFDSQIAFLDFQENTLETMYDAKKLETAELCFMNKKETTALMMYSMSVYRKLNLALRNQDQAALAPFETYLKVLNSALDKLKNFEGYVKRGANTDLTRYDDHQTGSVVVYPAFTSTSIGKGFPGNVRTLILSKNCKYIAPFSVVPEEEEVLCKPNTEFKVIYRKDNKKVLHLFLKEI